MLPQRVWVGASVNSQGERGMVKELFSVCSVRLQLLMGEKYTSFTSFILPAVVTNICSRFSLLLPFVIV